MTSNPNKAKIETSVSYTGALRDDEIAYMDKMAMGEDGQTPIAPPRESNAAEIKANDKCMMGTPKDIIQYITSVEEIATKTGVKYKIVTSRGDMVVKNDDILKPNVWMTKALPGCKIDISSFPDGEITELAKYVINTAVKPKPKTGVLKDGSKHPKKCAVDDTDGRVESSKEAKQEAEKILKTGAPIEYILDVFNDIHIGDRRIGEVLILSSGSACISNCQGIHPKLSGESGKGKSHSCKTMIHLMPKEYTMNTSLSAKAMFYMGESLKPGTVVFSDDVELSPEVESIIKRSTSEFQQGIDHITVNINREAEYLHMPPRILWWLASVETELDLQTINRQLDHNVDESDETDEQVMLQQLRAAGTGQPEYPETFEISVCREIFASVKNTFVSVTIPFFERIKWRGSGNRRNLPMLLDMIKVYALFYYKQREIVELPDGTFELHATEDDFKRAANQYVSRAKAQESKLNDREMKIIDFLASYGTATVTTIAEYVGLPYEPTRRILIGRKDKGTKGLLGKVKQLSVTQMTRGEDGAKESRKEFTLSASYNQIESYETVVSLRDK